MMLDHYQQTKNLLVSYSPNALGSSDAPALRHRAERPGGVVNVRRVDVSAEAADMIRRLRAEHGPVMFHQSGGCCDGSSPMCYPKGDFWTGDADVLLGTIDVRAPGSDR